MFVEKLRKSDIDKFFAVYVAPNGKVTDTKLFAYNNSDSINFDAPTIQVHYVKNEKRDMNAFVLFLQDYSIVEQDFDSTLSKNWRLFLASTLGTDYINAYKNLMQTIIKSRKNRSKTYLNALTTSAQNEVQEMFKQYYIDNFENI